VFDVSAGIVVKELEGAGNRSLAGADVMREARPARMRREMAAARIFRLAWRAGLHRCAWMDACASRSVSRAENFYRGLPGLRAPMRHRLRRAAAHV